MSSDDTTWAPFWDFSENSLAPFQPAGEETMNTFISFAGIEEQDVFFDLGCGDGRLCVAAAKNVGCKCIGVDLDPSLITKAVASAEEAGVTHLTSFFEQDIRDTDLSAATVIFVFLLPEGLVTIRNILLERLVAGARVITLVWPLPGLKVRATCGNMNLFTKESIVLAEDLNILSTFTREDPTQ